jgi:hypothetical protein
MDPQLLVLPGHTNEPVPFDGVAITAPLEEVAARTPLLQMPEADFVAYLLAHIPPTPPNHGRIVALNEAGDLTPEAAALEAGANRCAIS